MIKVDKAKKLIGIQNLGVITLIEDKEVTVAFEDKNAADKFLVHKYSKRLLQLQEPPLKIGDVICVKSLIEVVRSDGLNSPEGKNLVEKIVKGCKLINEEIKSKSKGPPPLPPTIPKKEEPPAGSANSDGKS